MCKDQAGVQGGAAGLVYTPAVLTACAAPAAVAIYYRRL